MLKSYLAFIVCIDGIDSWRLTRRHLYAKNASYK